MSLLAYDCARTSTMSYLTDLTDAQWVFIEPIIPPQEEGPGRPWEVALRRAIDAIMYLDRTRCQWRMIPLGVDPGANLASIIIWQGLWEIEQQDIPASLLEFMHN